MIHIDDNCYEEPYPATRVSRNSPRYGMEVEFDVKSEFLQDEEDTSSSGKFGSCCFSRSVLDEFENKIGDSLNWGQDGDLLEIRTSPGSKDKVLKEVSLIYKGNFETVKFNQPHFAGIHVHSDINNFSPKELYRNIKFLSSRKKNMYSLIKKITRRGIRTEELYGNIPTFDHYEDSINYETQSIRDGIFLFSDHSTHEFRMFKSTTDFNEAATCLDFIDAVLHFSRDEYIWEECPNKFTNFVLDNKNKFPYLLSTLKGD